MPLPFTPPKQIRPWSFRKSFSHLIADAAAQKGTNLIRSWLYYEYMYLAPPQAGSRRGKLRGIFCTTGRRRRKMPCSRPERRSLPAQDSSTITCTMAARTGGLLLLSAGTWILLVSGNFLASFPRSSFSISFAMWRISRGWTLQLN